MLFNYNWKNYFGDCVDFKEILFIDDNWEQVNLPHDFGIQDFPEMNSLTVEPENSSQEWHGR